MNSEWNVPYGRGGHNDYQVNILWPNRMTENLEVDASFLRQRQPPILSPDEPGVCDSVVQLGRARGFECERYYFDVTFSVLRSGGSICGYRIEGGGAATRFEKQNPPPN